MGRSRIGLWRLFGDVFSDLQFLGYLGNRMFPLLKQGRQLGEPDETGDVRKRN